MSQSSFLKKSAQILQSDALGSSIVMSTTGFQELVGTQDGKGLHWTSDINQELPIKISMDETLDQIKPETIPRQFIKMANERLSKPALNVMRNGKHYQWTFEQFLNDIVSFAKSLHAIGVDQRKAINIMGFNSPEWAIAFYGGIFHNNVISGVYTTNGAQACEYQALHSEAQVIVVDNLQQLQLFMGILDKLPEVKALIAWGLDKLPEEALKDSRIHTYKEFLFLGQKIPHRPSQSPLPPANSQVSSSSLPVQSRAPQFLRGATQSQQDAPHQSTLLSQVRNESPRESMDATTWRRDDQADVGKYRGIDDSVITDIVQQQRPGQCAVLIYTSGTTGNPKGVMLSHDNLIFNSKSICLEIIEEGDDIEDQRVVSYLPLSHIAGLQIDLSCQLYIGNQVFFAKPDALQGTLVETLQWARPTIFMAVPRVWEKFEDKLKEIAKTKPQILQSISNWAKGHGTHRMKLFEQRKDPHYMFHVANYLILSKIKQAIGLDKSLIFMFGAAPLKQSSIEYFGSLDIPLMNMYGLSETTGSTTVSNRHDYKSKMAGREIRGCEIKISDPDESSIGEIRVKGRHVMMGYLKNEEATKECIDSEGYFRSGDLGMLDSQGFLKITGRIKELIITAGGENVAPVPIEDNFKAACPACSNIMLVGENQRFMAALITFKVEIDMTTGLPSTNLTADAINFFKAAGVDVKTSDDACKNAKVLQLVQQCVEQTNKKSVSRAAHIKKFALLPVDFSQPGGELTPTMKLKRKVTEKKFKKEIDELYASEAKM